VKSESNPIQIKETLKIRLANERVCGVVVKEDRNKFAKPFFCSGNVSLQLEKVQKYIFYKCKGKNNFIL